MSMPLKSVVQANACKARSRNQHPLLKGLPKCHICEASRSAASACRFAGKMEVCTASAPDVDTACPPVSCTILGARVVISPDFPDGSPIVTFNYTDGPSPRHPKVFNRKFTHGEVELKKVFSLFFSGCDNCELNPSERAPGCYSPCC